MDTKHREKKQQITVWKCIFLGIGIGAVVLFVHYFVKVRKIKAIFDSFGKKKPTPEEIENNEFGELKKKALRSITRSPGNADMLLLWTSSRLENTKYLRISMEEDAEGDAAQTLNNICAEYKSYQLRNDNVKFMSTRAAKKKRAARSPGPSPVLVKSIFLALLGNESVKYMLAVSPDHRKLLKERNILDTKEVPLLTEKGVESMLKWILCDQPTLVSAYICVICDRIEELNASETQSILRSIVQILVRLLSITPPKFSMDRHLGKDLTLPSFLSRMKTRVDMILAYEKDKVVLEKMKKNPNSVAPGNKQEKEKIEELKKRLSLQEKMASSDLKTPNEKILGLITEDLFDVLIAVTGLIGDCFKSVAQVHREYAIKGLGLDNEAYFKLLFMFPTIFFAPNQKREGGSKSSYYMYRHGLEAIRSEIRKKKKVSDIQGGEKERLKLLLEKLDFTQRQLLRAPNKASGLLLHELDFTLRKYGINGPSDAGIQRCIEELAFTRDLAETVTIVDLLGKSLKAIRQETEIDIYLLMDMQHLISERSPKYTSQNMENVNGNPVFYEDMPVSKKRGLIRKLTDLFVSTTMQFKKKSVSKHLGIELKAAGSK